MKAWVPSATCKQIIQPQLCIWGSKHYLDRPQRLLCPVLKAPCIRPVRGHHGVQRGASRAEALLLGLVSEEIREFIKKQICHTCRAKNVTFFILFFWRLPSLIHKENPLLLLRFDSLSKNESHELRHAVSVIMRRSESVLLHGPTRRKDDKISHCRAL